MNFIDSCGEDAIIGTMALAIKEMQIPRTKQVRVVHSFKGALTIGDPTEYYESAITIQVERYPRTKKASAMSATKYNAPKEEEDSKQMTQGGAVNLQRTYKIQRNDEVVEVEREEVDKAYTYGKTIVPLFERNVDALKPGTYMGLDVLGFVERKGVRSLEMDLMISLSDTCLSVRPIVS
jgi:ATP-dependent DNA helicase 2 subunit 2